MKKGVKIPLSKHKYTKMLHLPYEISQHVISLNILISKTFIFSWTFLPFLLRSSSLYCSSRFTRPINSFCFTVKKSIYISEYSRYICLFPVTESRIYFPVTESGIYFDHEAGLDNQHFSLLATQLADAALFLGQEQRRSRRLYTLLRTGAETQ